MEETINKKEKIAMIGTPCHMIAASKMDEFSDILGESPYRNQNWTLLYGKLFLQLHEQTFRRK